jgi:uncharacterized membrane protein (UPF0127 family)
MSRNALLIALSFLLLFAAASQPGLSQGTGETSWPGKHAMQLGDHTIAVEIAATDPQRARGLSGRANLAADSGLLFVFPGNDTYGIWMKEMNFAIDIVWISQDLKVIHIAEDVSPATYPEVFMPQRPARYVLEMKAGSARQLGIAIGTVVRLPDVLAK